MIRLLIPAIGLLTVLGCQPKPGAAGEQAAQTVLPVPSEWVLVSCEMEGTEIPAANDRAFLKINDGQLGGNTGCNSFGGDWSLEEKKLKVPGVMATKMFCQEAAAQEELFLNLLNGEVAYAVRGDELSLTGGAGQLNFRRKGADMTVSEKQVAGIQGLFTYLADAPGFQHCADGERFAVLQEGDAYRELERTYLELGRPGEPALVIVEGEIVDNPEPEGHPRALRIKQVRKLTDDRNCP